MKTARKSIQEILNQAVNESFGRTALAASASAIAIALVSLFGLGVVGALSPAVLCAALAGTLLASWVASALVILYDYLRSGKAALGEQER